MANLTSHSTLTLSYARSLLDLANQHQQAVQAGDELRDVQQIVSDDPLFGLFFSDPVIGRAERMAVLDKAFQGRVSPLMLKFLSVMNVHNRLGILQQVTEAYDELLDEQLGKLEVSVTVAQTLSADQLEQVRQKISAAFKKDAVVYQIVDDSIIGGMILNIGDRLIDGSVRTQLEIMKERMLAAQR